MNDDDKFWLRIATMGAALLALTIGGCTTATIYTDAKIAQEVIHGVDPILARCAHDRFNDIDALCASRKP